MMRSKNYLLFEKMSEGTVDRDFDFKSWVDNDRNILWEEDGSVGLATYEYPGAYTLHWFFKRGIDAQDLARRMVKDLFDNSDAQVVLGFTKNSPEYRHARIAARRLGMKSQGVFTFPLGDHELLTMTKEEFYERLG